MKSIKHFNKAYEKLKNKNPELFENTNLFCLISGETDETEIIPFLSSIFICSLFVRLLPFVVLIVIIHTLADYLNLDYLKQQALSEFMSPRNVQN